MNEIEQYFNDIDSKIEQSKTSKALAVLKRSSVRFTKASVKQAKKLKNLELVKNLQSRLSDVLHKIEHKAKSF